MGIEVAHVTRDSDTTFKVALTCEAGAAVTVRTHWAWETTAMLRCARRREALWHPQREVRGRGISICTVYSVCDADTELVCAIWIPPAQAGDNAVIRASRVNRQNAL